MASPSTDVFLSYKTEDRSRLIPLVKALEAEGFTVWWDVHIGGGTNWHEDIEQHLEAAKCVVVAWSKWSIGHDGQFVRDEARRAQRRDAYVPICLDSVEPPLGFGEIQALPLKGWRADRSDRRFIALVAAVQSHVSGAPIPHSIAQFRQPLVTRRTAIVGAIGGSAVAAAGAGGWLLFKSAPANAKRIAVLPFANLSGDPGQEYFSDGVAEELRSALTRVGLEVIGRASSDAVKDMDTKSAASRLGVANVLTGSVRRSPATIRVNAQLVRGSDGVERWAQSYDRAPGDALKIQADIATSVAEALSVRLAGAAQSALAAGGTRNVAAHDLFLKAIAIRQAGAEESNFRQSIQLFDQAAKLDPNYAIALTEQASTINEFTGYWAPDGAAFEKGTNEALRLSRRALAISPALASAHVVLAGILWTRLDFKAGLAEFERASVEDMNAERLRDYSNALADIGRFEDAIDVANRAVTLDPLNPRAMEARTYALYYARRYADAANSAREALEIAPGRAISLGRLSDSLLMLGKMDAAKAALVQMPANDVFRLTKEAVLEARAGNVAASDKALDRMRELYSQAASYQEAQIHAQRGNADRALEALEVALKVRDPGLTTIAVDPLIDPLRQNRRFRVMIQGLNLPDVGK